MRAIEHRLFLILVLLALGIPANAQSGLDPEQEIRASLVAGEIANVAELVGENRLSVLPLSKQLLKEASVALLEGDNRTYESAVAHVETLAETFEDQFGERSARVLIDRYRTWSPSDLEVKLRADSLYDAATAARTDQEMREQAWLDYEQAKEAYESIEDETGLATVLGGLGFIAFYRSGEEALDLNTQAYEARVLIDDRQQVGNALNTIGSVYRQHFRDLDKAVEFYDQALEIRGDIGDFRGQGRTLSFTGLLLYQELNEYERGMRYMLRAADAYMKAGLEEEAAQAQNEAGVLLYDMGRPEEALPLLLDARDMVERAGNEEAVAGITNNIGIAYRMLGDFDSALEAYQVVIDMARSSGNKAREADVTNNLSALFTWAERPERVRTFAERARAIYADIDNPEGELAANINLGSSLFELRELEGAIEVANASVAAADSLGDLISLIEASNLLGGALVRSDRPEESTEAFDRANELARQMSLPVQEFGSVLGKSEAFQRMSRDEEAIQSYEEAFRLLEGIRSGQETTTNRARFLAMMRRAHEEYLHYVSTLYMETGTDSLIHLAFSIAERAKARSLLEELTSSFSRLQKGNDDELFALKQDLEEVIELVRGDIITESHYSDADPERIAGFKDELASFEEQLSGVNDQIRDKYPRFAELSNPSPRSLSDMQALAGQEGGTIINYSVGDSSSVVWAITGDKVEMRMLPPRNEWAPSVEALRFALENPQVVEPERFASTAFAVYEIFIDPIKDALESANHVLILPDGAMSYIPFEVLVTESDPVSDWQNMTYLMDQVSISYAQSASVYAQTVAEREYRVFQPDRAFLALGDPIFNSDEVGPGEASLRSARGALAQLPFTAQEVSTITSLLDGETGDVLLGNQAEEGELKRLLSENSYGFVHLATHGLINEDVPDNSSLALSIPQGTDEDGFLRASEIFNMSINADLIVLSACETGLGTLIRGEGMLGLTRAFLYAGVPSQVVSLWSVSDASTSALMGEFYKRYSSNETDIAEALGRAKQVLRAGDEFAHPFYWAAFVAMGDWK